MNNPEIQDDSLRVKKPEGSKPTGLEDLEAPSADQQKELILKLQKIEVLIKETLKTRAFCAEENEPAIVPVHWKKGSSPLVLVLGENASGKSLFKALLLMVAEEDFAYEGIFLGMDERTGTGLQKMKWFNERQFSTGFNSIIAFQGAVRTSDKRDEYHIVFFDEPDIGLSDSVSAGMGIEIKENILDSHKSKGLYFLITHSTAMIKQLADLDPHYIYLGENPPETLKEWLERPVVPADLNEVMKDGRERFTKIQRLLDQCD